MYFLLSVWSYVLININKITNTIISNLKFPTLISKY